MEDGFLTLHTTLAPEALKEKLQRWEPWLARFDFDNGVSTRDCAKLTPFNERPLDKVALFASAVPFAELAGGRLLDIGSNAGHNSIHAAVKYRFSTIGIDIKSRHIEVSRFLAGLAAASCEFELASAETFSRPREFDVVLHFGTLYHLPNPPSLAPAEFGEPETGRLPRAGDSGLRSSAGSQHLLFHAHAE